MPVNGDVNVSLLFEAYADFDITTWMIFSAVSACIGTVFNSYTLVVILYFKTLQRPHYILIACIALCSLMCSAVFIPFEITQAYVRIHFRSTLGGDRFCSIETTIFAIFFSATILGQLLVAINRWLAVFAPIFFMTNISARVAIVAFVVVGLGIPLSYYIIAYFADWIHLGLDLKFGDCAEKDTSDTLMWVRQSIIAYFPCGMAVVLYLAILARIVLSPSNERRRALRHRSRGSIPMVINVFVYTSCVILSNAYIKTGFAERLELLMWVKFGTRTAYSVNPVSSVSLQLTAYWRSRVEKF